MFALVFQDSGLKVVPFGLKARQGPIQGTEQVCNASKEEPLTKLHEKTDRRRATRASVCPEDNIILGWVIPTFKKVEEQMPSFDINVSCVRASLEYQLAIPLPSDYSQDILHSLVAKVTLLDAHAVTREERVPHRREFIIR